jgi:transcriptional regulator with XRE-family HTH domain
MKAHQHTQTTFAKLVGVSQSKVSDWLLGRHISLANAIAVRDVAGVPVEAWLEPVTIKRLARSA